MTSDNPSADRESGPPTSIPDVETKTPDRTQERIWHDMFMPDDVAHVRSMARSAVARHVAPVARQLAQGEERRDSFPWSAFKGLASDGCFAVPFPAPHGAGLKHPMLATCIVTEEIAYESSSMAGVYDGQCILNARALSFASTDVRDHLLPALIAGDSAFSFATTEPDTSSDLSPAAMRTAAHRDGNDFVVNGRKRWITNSVVADWVSLLCRDGDNQAMTMLVVDMHSPGVTVGEPDLKMGHRGQLTADVVFENVRVPGSQVLGEPGRGLPVALACLVAGRIGIAAAGVGVAQAALDLAVERLRTRELFGKKLGAMQHWQFRLAEHAIRLEAARSMYQKAAIRFDQGDLSAEPEGSMAKVYATTLANDLARDAVQIYGGYGFARHVAATGETFRLEEIFRDAKVLEIFEGANEVLLWVIARQLIGRDVTG